MGQWEICNKNTLDTYKNTWERFHYIQVPKEFIRIQKPTPLKIKDKLQISWDCTFNTFLAILLKGTNQTGKQKPIIFTSGYLKFLKEFEKMPISALELT